MTKAQLIEENEKLKARVKELENRVNDIDVDRIKMVLGKNNFGRTIEGIAYRDPDRRDAIVFQFTDGIAIVPHAANSFTIVFERGY